MRELKNFALSVIIGTGLLLLAYCLGGFVVEAVCWRNGGCLEDGITPAHIATTTAIFVIMIAVITSDRR